MAQLTKAQQEIKSAFISWQNLDNRLMKSIDEHGKTTNEIQKDVAGLLSSKKKQTMFALFMEHQKKIDGDVTQRLQTCIRKPATQRYILKVPSDQPLKQVFTVRTASKELLKLKLDGKAITNQKQIDQKGVYHVFKYDIPEKKKPTGTTATQKVVTDFDYTKENFLALVNSGKIKFADA